jgi:hypothetical protein
MAGNYDNGSATTTVGTNKTSSRELTRRSNNLPMVLQLALRILEIQKYKERYLFEYETDIINSFVMRRTRKQREKAALSVVSHLLSSVCCRGLKVVTPQNSIIPFFRVGTCLC